MGNKKTVQKKVKPYEIGELDQYLFGQGTHYEIYKKLGAHKVTAVSYTHLTLPTIA